MYKLRIISDLEQCRDIWNSTVPQETIWDLWEFRDCFQQHYKRPACFITGEESEGAIGLLPLSWIDESQNYGYFPGETWQGKTWLEQNRLPANNRMLKVLLNNCQRPYHLRYLVPSQEPVSQEQCAVDELNYSFRPSDYNYDIENYFQVFSKKSSKNIKREIASLHMEASYRYDDISDFEHLVRLNINNFGDSSFFYDIRFRESFRTLMHYLHDMGWLRITTVIINGNIAAIDIGCIYHENYILFGGGTNRTYPSVAKLINLHHMQRACRERLKLIDFLCGDFSWKKKFHLSESPLYLLSNYMTKTHTTGYIEQIEAGYAE